MVFPGASRAVVTAAMREAVDDAKAVLPDITRRVRARLAPLYPDIDEAIAWLWVRTVKSPSPRFPNCDVPLVRSFALSKKKGIWLKPVVDGNEWRFEVVQGEASDEKGLLYRDGGEFKCLLSGETITREWIESEYCAGRGGARCVARVLKGKRYEAVAGKSCSCATEGTGAQECVSPLELGPIGTPRAKALFGRYGMEKWSDLFLPRQRAALAAMEAEIAEEKKLGDAGRLLLRLGVAHAANRNSMLSIWDASGDKTQPSYRMSRYLRMSWLFSETNPFGGASGDFEDCCKGAFDAVSTAPHYAKDGEEICITGSCDGEDVEAFLGGFLTGAERKNILPERIVANDYEDLGRMLREFSGQTLRYRILQANLDAKKVSRMPELRATIAVVFGVGFRFVSFEREGNIVRFAKRRNAEGGTFITRREVRLAAAAVEGEDEIIRFGKALCAVGDVAKVLAADGRELPWLEVVDLVAENIKRKEVAE